MLTFIGSCYPGCSQYIVMFAPLLGLLRLPHTVFGLYSFVGSGYSLKLFFGLTPSFLPLFSIATEAGPGIFLEGTGGIWGKRSGGIFLVPFTSFGFEEASWRREIPTVHRKHKHRGDSHWDLLHIRSHSSSVDVPPQFYGGLIKDKLCWC